MFRSVYPVTRTNVKDEILGPLIYNFEISETQTRKAVKNDGRMRTMNGRREEITKFKRHQNKISKCSFLLAVVMAKRKECVIGSKKK